MAGGNDFDIYQTEAGYVAVTNEVRRVILNALAKRDRQLPELVKLTKKAKPTLSSVHMKELLAQRLIEEIHHPTDKRKKIYRLKARRIGSSNLPVEQLRSAVKQYAGLSPDASRIPLRVAVEAIADAPPGADPSTLRRQARRLGALGAELLLPAATAAASTTTAATTTATATTATTATAVASGRELVTGLAAFFEREGLARPLRLDLERLTLEMEIHPALAPEAADARLADILAGFVEGAAAGKGVEGAPTVALGEARRFTLGLGSAAPAAPRAQEKESPPRPPG